MSVAVHLHESLQVIQISVDGDSVFLRRDQASEFLGLFMRALLSDEPMADVIPLHPGWSVKVGDPA